MSSLPLVFAGFCLALVAYFLIIKPRWNLLHERRRRSNRAKFVHDAGKALADLYWAVKPTEQTRNVEIIRACFVRADQAGYPSEDFRRDVIEYAQSITLCTNDDGEIDTMRKPDDLDLALQSILESAPHVRNRRR